MNKTIGIVIVVLVLIGGGIYASTSSKSDTMMKKEMSGDQMMNDKMEDGSMMMKDEMMKKEVMKDDAMMAKEDMVMKNDGMKSAGDTMVNTDTMMKAGSYEAYSPEKIAKASSGKVVLFFRASWCPTCNTLQTDIKANLGKIPSDLTLLDVNYDNSTELKKKYGVTYQHTFVQVDAQGNLIKKWSGGSTLAQVVAEVK
ncbi:MAG: thioredoxin family protein [Candidatus Zambryskibacteria bacterium]|nr:thioredoxin family protein [Candidatus Zambryskibacteria bacterium]